MLERGDHDLAAALASTDRALTVIGTSPQLHHLRVSILGNRGTLLGDMCRIREAVESTRLAVSLAEGKRRPDLLVRSAEMNFAYGQWDDALLDLEQAAGNLREHFLFIQHGVMALITGRQNAWQQAERYLAALDG